MFWGPNKSSHRPVLRPLVEGFLLPRVFGHIICSSPPSNPMQLAKQGLTRFQLGGPIGVEGQSRRMGVGGRGPGRNRTHPDVIEGSLWPELCFFRWGPQTTALGWEWACESRSWARLRQTQAVKETPGVQCSPVSCSRKHLSLDPWEP